MATSFVKVHIDGNGDLYQKAVDGYVVGYYEEDGTLAFETPAAGIGSEVVDPNPPLLDWMLNA